MPENNIRCEMSGSYIALKGIGTPIVETTYLDYDKASQFLRKEFPLEEITGSQKIVCGGCRKNPATWKWDVKFKVCDECYKDISDLLLEKIKDNSDEILSQYI